VRGALISGKTKMPKTLLLLAAVLVAGPASAVTSPIMQLLEISFACPSDAYEFREYTAEYFKYLDRYKWQGDGRKFSVAIDRRTFGGDEHGIARTDEKHLIEAAYGDLEISVNDGTDVYIRCKKALETNPAYMGCITDTTMQPDGTRGDGRGADHAYFHACSTASADDIRIAIEHLLGYR
jgi:hypothetical protein